MSVVVVDVVLLGSNTDSIMEIRKRKGGTLNPTLCRTEPQPHANYILLTNNGAKPANEHFWHSS